MGQPRIPNNVWATLAAPAGLTDATLTLTAGQGARFPALTNGDWTYATLVDASNDLEIVKVTAVTGDVLTVARASDGTISRTWAAGARVECRFNAAYIADLKNYILQTLDAGGLVMTGPLMLASDPTTPNGLVTKNYADTALFPLSRPWMVPVGYAMVQTLSGNQISLGWDGSHIQTSVDVTGTGFIWNSSNLNPAAYAPAGVTCNWNSGIVELAPLFTTNQVIDTGSPWVAEGVRWDGGSTRWLRVVYLRNV